MPDSRAGLERLGRIVRATVRDEDERADSRGKRRRRSPELGGLAAELGIAVRFGVRTLGRALMLGVLRTAVGILAAVLLLFHAAN
jgi:hypothetical protein